MRNREEDLPLTREEGLDAVITAHKLDAVMFPGSGGANYATKAGYPIVVVPFGMVINYADGAKGARTRSAPSASASSAALRRPEDRGHRVCLRAGDQEACSSAARP